MPVIPSAYKAPFYLFNKDIETILPALFRRVGNNFYTRQRIETPDEDFLDLDWLTNGNKDLVILSHGLEGSTTSRYFLGMVQHLSTNGFDCLGWNYRGCSGELNKRYRFYHSGETSDLDFVIKYAISTGRYKYIYLIGFSIGGNITLKYLGEKQSGIYPEVKKAVTFSVPCHLESGAYLLAQKSKKIYMNRFLKSLNQKFKAKAALMPEKISCEGLDRIKDFIEFDEKYTAPMFGYKSAKDYWTNASSIYYLSGISIPTLLVNSKNDPFLTPQCFPVKEAEENPFLYLEMPERGGHCGYTKDFFRNLYWSEERAVEFLRNEI